MAFLRLPHSIPGILLYASALLAATPAQTRAQSDAQLPPAYLAVVNGAATLERDGLSQPAEVNVPLVAGDRLRTAAGRLEIAFPDGSVLDVDEASVVDLQSPTRLRLMKGRARLVVPGAAPDAPATRYQIDTPAASARTDGAGEYRLAVADAASGPLTQLAIVRGSAALLTERGTMPAQTGELVEARAGEAPSMPQPFNSANRDAFDDWSEAQQEARTASAASGEYLPPDLEMYGPALDRNGSWAYDEPYGYVWYPRVASTWRPYYNGRWTTIEPYGWTWIGFDSWSWPTHHYGRWGFRNNAWFWIPGRTWGPAWVSWAATPGYVSWCPLGFDGRPLSPLSFGAASLSLGWVIVPRTVFGDTGYRIDRYAVSTHRFAHDTPFVEQSVPPVAPRAAPGRALVIPATGAGVAVHRNPAAPPAAAHDAPAAREPRAFTPGAPAPPASVHPAAAPRYPPTIRVERPAAPTAAPEPSAAAPAPPAGFRAPLAGPRRAPEVVAPRWTTPSEQPEPRWAPSAATRPARSPAPAPAAAGEREPQGQPRSTANEPAAARTPPPPRENVIPPPHAAGTPAPNRSAPPHAKPRGGE